MLHLADIDPIVVLVRTDPKALDRLHETERDARCSASAEIALLEVLLEERGVEGTAGEEDYFASTT
ncbi:MAG: hypothetical protein ACLQME_05365 [Alphaproteobacteria bacterium]